LTGASLVQAKKGKSNIVVDFNGPLGGGAGLPLGAFQLATLPKGKKHAKIIPLASVAYDPKAHTMMLTPRGKLNFNVPLKLTISGLTGGPATVLLSKHGASLAAVLAGQVGASTAPEVMVARPAAPSAAAVDVLLIGSLEDLGVPSSRRHHGL
jgi:hypothetical protein